MLQTVYEWPPGVRCRVHFGSHFPQADVGCLMAGGGFRVAGHVGLLGCRVRLQISNLLGNLDRIID